MLRAGTCHSETSKAFALTLVCALCAEAGGPGLPGAAPFNVLLTCYTLFERDSEEQRLDRKFLKRRGPSARCLPLAVFRLLSFLLLSCLLLSIVSFMSR